MSILRILSLIFLFISVLLMIRMLRTYRKVRGVAARSCFLGIIFPGITLLIYGLVIGSRLAAEVLWMLFFFGLALGMWQGKNTKVWLENGVPKAQNTVWFLVIWLISFAFTQFLLSIGQSSGIKIGIGTMCLSTGLAFGTQGNILFRLLRLKKTPLAESASSSGGSLPAKRKAAHAPASAHPVRFCRSCGGKVEAGDRFCRNCRQGLQ